MTIAIGAGVPAAGRLADLEFASPAERQADDALAAQDSATETLSQGIARHRSGLDRLFAAPGGLARFEQTDSRNDYGTAPPRDA